MVPVLAVAACSSKPQRSVKSFCDRLRVEQTLLTTRLTDPTQVEPVLERFRTLDKLAPEQIRDDWRAITQLVEKVAGATDLSPEAQSDLTRLGLATQKNVEAVTAYATQTCGVNLAAPSATTAVTVTIAIDPNAATTAPA
jgi:hypothetical protein